MLKPSRRAFAYSRPEWELPTSPIKVTVVYGQSRADNRSEGTAWCYYPRTTNTRLLMMNNPRAPGRTYQGPFDSTSATAFITLEDCRYGSYADPGGHTASSRDPLGQSLATALLHLDARDVALGRSLRRRALIVAGEGGRKISELVKGAAPFAGTGGTYVIYDRMIAMVQKAQALAAAIYDQDIEIEAIYWLQGEADAQTTTQSAYYSALAQLVTDMTTDLQAITGQASIPPFFMDQVTSRYNTGAGNPASLAQLQLALANPNGKTYLVGPAYSMPVNSRELEGGATYHFPSLGVMAWGEHFGHAVDAVIQGGAPQCCYVTGYSLVGSTLTLNVSVPTGSLTTDSDIPAATNKGFKLTDTGGATISSVTLGSNTITIALSKAPAAGATIEYAYGTTGDPLGTLWTGKLDLQGATCSTAAVWGNVRDGRADACTYATGYTLRNFLAAFKQTIS